MGGFIARRLLQGLLLLVLVATVVFFLGRFTGNPVDLMLPEDATAEDRAHLIVRDVRVHDLQQVSDWADVGGRGNDRANV